MMIRNLVISNVTGNVGKTTVAQHLFRPRMHGAAMILVETINAGGAQDTLRGKQYSQIADAALMAEHGVIVDVGASNAESFFAGMRERRGSHQHFDYFVVPTGGRPKQVEDTITTCEVLREIGVERDKIRILFNQVSHDDDFDAVFGPLILYAQETQACVINRDAVIHANDLFPRLRAGDDTIEAILARQQGDLKAALAAADTKAEKLRIVREIGLRELATGVQEELDIVFGALFAEPARISAGRKR